MPADLRLLRAKGLQIEEAPLFCLLPQCFTALASLALFFLAENL